MINKPLIRKLIKIVACGKRWNQGNWYTHRLIIGDRVYDERVEGVFTPKELVHQCNSCACIAGWTLALDKEAREQELRVDFDEIKPKATKILGLPSVAAALLFQGDNNEETVLRMLNYALKHDDPEEIEKYFRHVYRLQ